MSVGLIPVSLGAQVSAGIYGDKAAKYSALYQACTGYESLATVPEAWFAPAASVGDFDRAHLHEAFVSLTAGIETRAPLMVRSSKIGELPGENDSPSVYFDRSELAASFRRFASRVDEARSVSPQMGLVLMRMVGEESVLPCGKRVFGLTNVSIAADSHAPTSPREMVIAMVHGLGTNAVEGSQAIMVYADRETGAIRCVINQSNERLKASCGSLHVRSIDEYRQKKVDFFSLDEDAIVSQYLLGAVDDPDEEFSSRLCLQGGRLVDLNDYSRDEVFRFIGISPLPTAAMYAHLISVIQFLSSRFGPVQLEGAFANRAVDSLYLYQMLQVPVLPVHETPLNITSPVLASTDVIGALDAEMPLFWFDPNTDEKRFIRALMDLEELDHTYRNGGYALLAREHDRDVFDHSQNCKVRLSLGTENPSSHAITFARIQMHDNSSSGYLVAMNVVNNLPKTSHGYGRFIHRYKKVRIRSNGREMAVEIPRSRGLFGWLRRG